MVDINTLVAQANAATDQLEDQTEVQEGGFEYEVPPAGKTPARFIGYVELGKRKQRPYQGKEKPPAEEVRLVFELNGKKHRKTIEVEGTEREVTNQISVKVAKKLNDKAAFTKLFRAMTYGRQNIKHMAQMLGEAFLIDVVHNTVKGQDGAKDRTYANMKDSDGVWKIGAPLIVSVDDEGEEQTKKVNVPEPTKPIQLFLWNAPTKEQWDSLFIDGTKTVKDEKGNEREVSKNWLQRSIVEESLNFEGSPLQDMLGGIGDLDLNPEDSSGEAQSEPESAEEPEEAPKAQPKKKAAKKPAQAPSGDDEDPLDALDL